MYMMTKANMTTNQNENKILKASFYIVCHFEKKITHSGKFSLTLGDYFVLEPGRACYLSSCDALKQHDPFQTCHSSTHNLGYKMMLIN